jgi:hypothetical protein
MTAPQPEMAISGQSRKIGEERNGTNRNDETRNS